MNSDEIIAMAKAANVYASNQTDDAYDWHLIRDERFAALVAAAAKPQPLPEDQLWKAVEDGERAFVAGGPGTSWTLCVARAIEAAHGIRGEE